ncbi:MAG: M15 family metallopeptidase, partial [Bacteriovoracaceae bacterium]|nr:M15 family metallopeptidase [Bacteriovoracaceae bacterium]
YFGSENFVGKRIEGYNANKCLLTKEAVRALLVAQKEAQKHGLSLKVFDCYRPQMAVDHFVRWANDLEDIKTKNSFYPNVSKDKLFEHGYIAERSGHSRGSTVDLNLVRFENGKWIELDMGTIFDYFDPKSATNSKVGQLAKSNRLLLKSIMEAAGFRNYSKEWWHYTLRSEPFPDTYFNIPIN